MTADPTKLAKTYAGCFPLSRPWTEIEFAEFLADPAYLVATTGDAFALVRVVADQAEIITIAVPVSQRREGVARTMLLELFAQANAQGALEMFLEVQDDNQPAIALYDALGFTESGRRAGYYKTDSGESKDAIMMVKQLN